MARQTDFEKVLRAVGIEFYLGTVIGYALQYPYECPLQKHALAVSRYHETVYIIGEAVVLHDGPYETPPPRVEVAIGELIVVEGYVYRIDRAANDNLCPVRVARVEFRTLVPLTDEEALLA